MQVNILLLILSIAIMACSNSKSPGNINEETSTNLLDTLRVINDIKKQYAEINANVAQYDKVEKEVYDESTEGAILIAYYDNKVLKKITGTYYGETGKTLMEYYFNGNDFFFIYSKEFNYEKPLSVDHSGKVASTTENRYYFYKEELIKWISGNKSILTTSKEFLEQNKFFKEDFEKYKKLFTDYVPAENSQIEGDTVRCKYGSKCPDTGYIIKNSRNVAGRVIHVNPKNKNVPVEK